MSHDATLREKSLTQEGAKSMSLLSRSGRPSADITELWARLQEILVGNMVASRSPDGLKIELKWVDLKIEKPIGSH